MESSQYNVSLNVVDQFHGYIVFNGRSHDVADIRKVFWRGEQSYQGFCDADLWVVLFADNTIEVVIHDGSIDNGAYEVLADISECSYE